VHDLLGAFKEHDVLYTEVIHFEGATKEGQKPGTEDSDSKPAAVEELAARKEGQKPGTEKSDRKPVAVEELAAIKSLGEKVLNFRETCETALSELDRETKDMIELVRTELSKT
jgi:hypothetical protein